MLPARGAGLLEARTSALGLQGARTGHARSTHGARTGHARNRDANFPEKLRPRRAGLAALAGGTPRQGAKGRPPSGAPVCDGRRGPERWLEESVPRGNTGKAIVGESPKK